eukprot:CAMPEP_0194101898 /NCGR_PEP_ID=MMETSP0150-20130528/2546_1 /TAXON_ID=122233 /ORGANISM="Chaetoceros debilis, Strain MM31A-1" /LENGTH=96 /DNA_ID=CAMNT_0038788663 /DNA_START=26 /DNA_END=313 /DNA_ORIENTATION=+
MRNSSRYVKSQNKWKEKNTRNGININGHTSNPLGNMNSTSKSTSTGEKRKKSLGHRLRRNSNRKGGNSNSNASLGNGNGSSSRNLSRVNSLGPGPR